MFPLMNEKSVKMQLNLIVPTPDTHMTFPHSSYFLTPSPPLPNPLPVQTDLPNQSVYDNQG